MSHAFFRRVSAICMWLCVCCATPFSGALGQTLSSRRLYREISEPVLKAYGNQSSVNVLSKLDVESTS